MKTRITSLPAFLLLGMLVLNACGAPAAQEEPIGFADSAAATEAPPAVEAEQPLDAQSGADSEPMLKEGYVYETGTENDVALTTHLVIKTAEMHLLVKESDNAIERVTQIAGDTGGYIVSSRVWNQPYADGKSYKYATVTIAVPVTQFERALNRLRNLAVQVIDENASGDDVTDQYVDLQSQLANLEATRERIKSFLDQAQNVDEALRINQQLSEIERQIEEIKGRINYLDDRSAFSTITINIEPQLPPIEPLPAPKPLWEPGETLKEALEVLTHAYQNIADFLIWFLVVLVPIFGPPALVVWVILKLVFRKRNKPA